MPRAALHIRLMPHPDTWLCVRPEGLYCQPGDFFIDPVRAVPRAVITHGHSDHARPGHEAVLATPETLAIMDVRMGEGQSGISQQALLPGETVTMGGVKVRRGVTVRRVVAATHMATGSAYPQVHPRRADFQAFLAAQGAGRDIAHALFVRAVIGHDGLQPRLDALLAYRIAIGRATAIRCVPAYIGVRPVFGVSCPSRFVDRRPVRPSSPGPA